MKSRFLFPTQARSVGIIVLVIGLAFFSLSRYMENLPQQNLEVFVWHNFHSAESRNLGVNRDECFDDEIQLSLVLIGLLLIASAKEKTEDEHIAALRLESLQWAVYFNYFVFFLLIYFSYGLSFLVYSMYNILTLLVFFILRFRWKIWSLNRLLKTSLA